MIINPEDLHQLHAKFKYCAPIFIALGDEWRQKLILDIANAGSTGMNVTDLSANSELSRPAVSHHLKVLKDSGIIKPFKIGTQIFYKLNMQENLKEVEDLINSMRTVLDKIEATEKALTEKQEN